jgi:hypothetical protein
MSLPHIIVALSLVGATVPAHPDACALKVLKGADVVGTATFIRIGKGSDALYYVATALHVVADRGATYTLEANFTGLTVPISEQYFSSVRSDPKLDCVAFKCKDTARLFLEQTLKRSPIRISENQIRIGADVETFGNPLWQDTAWVNLPGKGQYLDTRLLSEKFKIDATDPMIGSSFAFFGGGTRTTYGCSGGPIVDTDYADRPLVGLVLGGNPANHEVFWGIPAAALQALLTRGPTQAGISWPNSSYDPTKYGLPESQLVTLTTVTRTDVVMERRIGGVRHAVTATSTCNASVDGAFAVKTQLAGDIKECPDIYTTVVFIDDKGSYLAHVSGPVYLSLRGTADGKWSGRVPFAIDKKVQLFLFNSPSPLDAARIAAQIDTIRRFHRKLTGTYTFEMRLLTLPIYYPGRDDFLRALEKCLPRLQAASPLIEPNAVPNESESLMLLEPILDAAEKSSLNDFQVNIDAVVLGIFAEGIALYANNRYPELLTFCREVDGTYDKAQPKLKQCDPAIVNKVNEARCMCRMLHVLGLEAECTEVKDRILQIGKSSPSKTLSDESQRVLQTYAVRSVQAFNDAKMFGRRGCLSTGKWQLCTALFRLGLAWGTLDALFGVPAAPPLVGSASQDLSAICAGFGRMGVVDDEERSNAKDFVASVAAQTEHTVTTNPRSRRARALFAQFCKASVAVARNAPAKDEDDAGRVNRGIVLIMAGQPIKPTDVVDENLVSEGAVELNVVGQTTKDEEIRSRVKRLTEAFRRGKILR